jgi:hypothetical protein
VAEIRSEWHFEDRASSGVEDPGMDDWEAPDNRVRGHWVYGAEKGAERVAFQHQPLIAQS